LNQQKGGSFIMRAIFAVGIATAMVTIALGAQAAKPAHKAAAKPEPTPAAAKPAAATPAAAKPAAATPAVATPAAATPAATPAAPAAPTPAASQPTSSAAATASTSGSASLSSSAELPPAAPAAEVPFGAAHQLVFGVDRVFGLSIWSEKYTFATGETNKQSGTAINLLNGSDSGVDGPAATPRVAFDFAVVHNVTAGAFVGYSHRSSSSQGTNAAGAAQPSTSYPSQSSALLGLRAGYTFGVTNLITVWPRLGFTYYTGHVSTGFKINGVLVDIEPTVVFTPVNHVGLTVSGIVDLPLSGSEKDANGASSSNKLMNFGLAAGIVGYL
jgi:hypothetical protein